MKEMMMSNRFILVLLVSLWAVGAKADDDYGGFRHTYVTRVGDLNGDGRLDVFLDYTPKIIPVMLDDLMISVPIKNTLADFVLLQNSTGTFTQSSVSSSQRDTMKQWAKQTAIELIFGDFNADGLLDVMIKKIASAIPGVRDVIAYGPDNRGSGPAAIRNMDSLFLLFIRDVVGWIENRAHYYDSAWYVACVPALAYVQILRYTDTGVPYYSVELAYVNQCGWVFDSTNYSVPAVYFLSALIDPMEHGELERGSPNAQVLSSILEGFLGIPFMRGILGSQQQVPPAGPKPYIPEVCRDLGPNPDPDTLRFCGRWALARILEKAVRDLGVRVAQCLDAGAGFPATHHYELVEGVCNIGAPRCNAAEVYQNESLVHPVAGYWEQREPIYDVKAGRWNPPAPMGWAAMNCTLDIPNACDTTGWQDAGPITFEVYPNDKAHKNIAIPPHIFAPGTVWRSVFEGSGEVKIYTLGEGSGKCPRSNETVGKQVFMTNNAFIRCHLKGQCHVMHPVGQ